jgi:hypothetical protein
MRQRWTDSAAIEAEITRIRSLPLDALRRRWRVMFGRTPPALSKDLLGRMLACRLQEQAFGSLDRESLRFLDGLARHGGSPRRQLKPGTVLVRDYHGQRHTVTVAADGFNWQGTTYPSLSAIARAITGTAWSGPRFFALARLPAHGPNKLRSRAGRNGRATECRCKPPHRRNPEAIGVGCASLLERLPQTCPGLLSDCAACGVLDR